MSRLSSCILLAFAALVGFGLEDGLLDDYFRERGCLAAGCVALVLEHAVRHRRSAQPAPRQAPHAGR